MKRYTMTLDCEVCGGPGAGPIDAVVSAYEGAFIAHRNPRVCADYLAEKRAAS